MAETLKMEEGCFDAVTAEIDQLLTGQSVPVRDLNFQRKEAMKHVPMTKVNTCYIVMTVVFNAAHDKVLLVQEAKPSCRGTWYLPAGRLEPRETLLEGAKREVKEEAGIDCEVDSLTSIHFGNARWIRVSFTGRESGGSLKTLEQQDEESLQAKYFDVREVFNRNINLRAADIIPPIQRALEYRSSLASTPVHPPLLPAVTPHRLLLHRFLLVVNLGDEEGLFALVSGDSSSKTHHIPVAPIAPTDDTLKITAHAVLREAIADEAVFPSVHGIIGVEYDGRSGEKDGMCITTLVSLPATSNRRLPTFRDQSYGWTHITNQTSLKAIKSALDNHIVRLIGK